MWHQNFFQTKKNLPKYTNKHSLYLSVPLIFFKFMHMIMWQSYMLGSIKWRPLNKLWPINDGGFLYIFDQLYTVERVRF